MDRTPLHSKLQTKLLAKYVSIHPVTHKRIEVRALHDLQVGLDLDQEMSDQPGLYSWYSRLWAEARHALRRAQYDEHCVAEDLSAMLRPIMAKTKGGKVTETELKVAVRRHPKMRRAFEERMVWENHVDAWEGLLEALKQRGRLLQSINKRESDERAQRDSSSTKPGR